MLSLPKKSLIKPLVAALLIIVVVSGLALYVLPKYIYISPFSSFYASGVVDHKSVGYGTDNKGNQLTTYTVSIELLNDDPVNHVSAWDTLAYIVSKPDWDMVAPQDSVRIKIFPNAQAQIVDIGVFMGVTPEWLMRNRNLPVSINLTSDKTQYTIGETANFTVRLINEPALSGGVPINVSLSLFKDCIFFVYFDGKLITSNDNLLQYNDQTEIKAVSLQPNQEIDYSFNWNLANIQQGTYSVRAYIGYSPPLQAPSITLTQLTIITVVR